MVVHQRGRAPTDADPAPDRFVLDLSAPGGDSAAAPPRSRRARTLAWLVVVAVAAGFALAATHGEHRSPNAASQHLTGVDQYHPARLVTKGAVVHLSGYRFAFPDGFVVVNRGHPRPHSGGRVDFIDARESHSGMDVTVFRGPIARSQADVQLPAPFRVNHTRIAGYAATVDAYGAGPAGPSALEVRVFVAPDVLVWVDSDNVPSNHVIAMLQRALPG